MNEQPQRAVELVEEWNYYDGFREGIVRIDGELFYAVTWDYSEDVWTYHARRLIAICTPVPPPHWAKVDYGVVTFTSSELERHGA